MLVATSLPALLCCNIQIPVGLFQPLCAPFKLHNIRTPTPMCLQGVYLGDAVAVVKRELKLECDYDLEIASQIRFKGLVSSDPSTSTQFNVPDVFPHLSSKRVLTTEWVQGVSIDKVRSGRVGPSLE